ncbi:MAG: M48 family metallopeptidase [Chloroflexi bacterium]|nr:M48 family metallopeptidase [Chloroflexota bacterium]
MNPLLVIILAAVLVEFALETTASLLNLKALQFEPPKELQDVYKHEEYRRSQEYTRVHTRFEFVVSSFHLVLLLAFWLSSGFNCLDRLVRSWGYGPVPTGLIYLSILFLAYGLITLPFNIYGTFVIEQRFGFNRTTPRLFLADRVKGLGLSLLLGAPLLAAILSLFQYAGRYSWLMVWAAVSTTSILLQFVTPRWIMPLFNKFTPLPPGELRDAVLAYAASVGYKVDEIFVMDSSKRSTKSNAFMTGFGRTKRIALFDTLIANHAVPELVGVLAHEVGHYKKRHVLQGTAVSFAHSGLLLFLLSVLLNNPTLYQAFFMDQPSIYTGLLFFGLLYTPVELLLSIGLQAWSRKNEYEADRFAVATAHDPNSMVSALKKLSAHNLSNLSPHPFYAFLNYSHPPLLQRIQALQREADRQNKQEATNPGLDLRRVAHIRATALMSGVARRGRRQASGLADTSTTSSVTLPSAIQKALNVGCPESMRDTIT